MEAVLQAETVLWAETVLRAEAVWQGKVAFRAETVQWAKAKMAVDKLAETWIFRRGSIGRREYCRRMENASAACYTKLQLHCNELSIQLESLHPILTTISLLRLVDES